MEDESLKIPELEIVKSNAQFANSIYRIHAKKKGNIVFSPLSAHACLSMLYQGMTGALLEDIPKILRLPNASATAEGYESIMKALNSSEDVTVIIANKVYIREGGKLKPLFKSTVEDKFLSEIESINFGKCNEAAQKINDWIKEKTKGKITDLFESKDLSPSDVLALVNTLYFKGKWKTEFQKTLTHPEPFHMDSENTIDVDTMKLTSSFLYEESEELDAKIVELKYKNADYSLVIILPNAIDGIGDLEGKLLKSNLSQIMEDAEDTFISLYLPKFKFEETIDFKDILCGVGLKDIFKPSGFLSGIVETDGGLYVSNCTQKVFIQVDETGSEAVAATKMVIAKRCGRRYKVEPIELRIDHPFIFLLTYKRGDTSYRNILFYGRVEKPVFI